MSSVRRRTKELLPWTRYFHRYRKVTEPANFDEMQGGPLPRAWLKAVERYTHEIDRAYYRNEPKCYLFKVRT